MKLLGEHKNDGVKLKFYCGCDPVEMAEFDEASKESKDATFMVVFAKRSELEESGDKIPISDYIVIYEVPDKMESYETMMNIIKEHYDKVEVNDFPWTIK